MRVRLTDAPNLLARILGWSQLRKKVKATFDPQKFLANVGEGKRFIATGRIRLFSPKGKLRTQFFTFSKAR